MNDCYLCSNKDTLLKAAEFKNILGRENMSKDQLCQLLFGQSVGFCEEHIKYAFPGMLYDSQRYTN